MIIKLPEGDQIESRKTFQPQTGQDIFDYVEIAKKESLSVFGANISSFMKGLHIYIKTDLLHLIKPTVLENFFCPLLEIDIDSLLAAFKFEGGEGLYVEISQDDLASIDANVAVMSSSDPGSRFQISINDAFKIAVRKLQPMNLLPGLVGQITGSRSIGFKNLQSGMFTVNFYQIVASRSLFGDGPSSGDKVELPIASSWYFVRFSPGNTF
jgi:hypothetical protein